MTISDVKEQILSVLRETDSFFEKDAELIFFGAGENESEELKINVVDFALKELIKDKIISEHLSDGKRCWILNKPLNQVFKKIDLSIETLMLVANAITKHADASGLDFVCDYSNVEEKDIQLLCVCLSSLIDFVMDSEEKGRGQESKNEDVVTKEEIREAMRRLNLGEENNGK